MPVPFVIQHLCSFTDLVVWSLFFLYPFLKIYYRLPLLAFHVLYAYTKWRETKHDPSTDSLPGRKGFFTAYVTAFHIFRGNLFPMIQEATKDGNPLHRIDLPLGNRAYIANSLSIIKKFHTILRASLDAPDGQTDGGPIMIKFMETIGGSTIFKLHKMDFLQTRTRFRGDTNGSVLPTKTASMYEHVIPLLEKDIDKALGKNDGVVFAEVLMRKFVLTALSHVLFSDYPFDNANEIGSSLEYITHTIFHRMCLMPALVAALDSTAKASIDVMKETAKRVLEHCKKDAESHPNYDPNKEKDHRKKMGGGMGVVAKLYGFKTEDEGFMFDDAQTLDLIYLMLVAGYDTSHSFFSHVMCHAARHPEAMKKIREDLANLTNGRFDDFDVMRKSAVLYAFYLECLRYTPPSPFQSRRIINKKLIIQGDSPIVLLPGDTVFLNNWKSHRDPNYYTEPDKFIADRFVNATEDSALENNRIVKNATSEQKDQIHTIHPFSKGMNECPGRFTVREEGIILLIWLAVNYELELLNDPPSRAGISFRPDGPVKIRFTRIPKRGEY